MNDEIKEYIKTGKKNLILIYVLYLCGIVAPIFPLVGVVMAYINRAAADQFLASHYIFVFRTFLLGCLGVFVSIITTLIFIGPVIYALVLIWFILRTAIGLKYIADNREHPNPTTFWIK